MAKKKGYVPDRRPPPTVGKVIGRSKAGMFLALLMPEPADAAKKAAKKATKVRVVEKSTKKPGPTKGTKR